MSAYWEKLRDPRWQKKRLEVMQKAKFVCEICGDSESTLNVHHKAYFKGKEPWEYLTNQLACLCENCHKENHKDIDALKFLCSLLPLDGPGSYYGLCILIAGLLNLDYEKSLELLESDGSDFFKKTYELGRNLRMIL